MGERLKKEKLRVGKGGLPPLGLSGMHRAGVNHPSQPVRFSSLSRSIFA
jgi:hypothetical protein